MSISERLKQLRKEKDLTQRQLAEKLNLSAGAIGMYESGNRVPDHDMLIRIADLFDVSVDYLLGRTNIRKFDLDIDNIAAMRSREMEGYNDLTKEEQEFLRNFVREYYERFGKKKESE